MIVETAPAKINLALHIRRRRPDGYHDIETLFAFARHGDVIRIAEADRLDFRIDGPFAEELTAEGDNLVLRAVAAFGGRGSYAITLDKRLPVASGMGGGSADAAATLRGLARLNGVAIDDPGLIAIAADLGADVPACLAGRTAFGRGRGDELTSADALTGTPLLLVNPGVAISTGSVFAGWDGADRGGILEATVLDAARAGRNDLEPAALRIAPEISAVLSMLRAANGALLVRMSGSGATCFALFADCTSRDRTADEARSRGWWCLASELS